MLRLKNVTNLLLAFSLAALPAACGDGDDDDVPPTPLPPATPANPPASPSR